jgi:hypothetical protein
MLPDAWSALSQAANAIPLESPWPLVLAVAVYRRGANALDDIVGLIATRVRPG